MRATKVYGFNAHVPGDRSASRVIVRATSRQAAVNAAQEAGLNVTVGYLAAYGATTGNDEELAAAVLNRVVYRADDDRHGPWHLAPVAPVRGAGRQARYSTGK